MEAKDYDESNRVVKKPPNKCAICGRFKSWDELYGIGGENDEEWIECFDCLSDFDRERFEQANVKEPV